MIPSDSGAIGYGSVFEPEVNMKIKKQFESAIQYFTNIIQTIIVGSVPGVPPNHFRGSKSEKKIDQSKKNDNNNNSISTPKPGITNESLYTDSAQPNSDGHVVGNESGETSPIQGTFSPPLPSSYLDESVGQKSYLRSHHKDTSDNELTSGSNSDNSRNSESKSRQRLLTSSNDGTDDETEEFKFDEEENAKLSELSKPENYDAMMEITKKMWKLSYRYREQLYFSLSTVQDSTVVDQLIAQSFNSFIDDCYMEIFAKYEFTHPNQIYLIKMMRTSPDRSNLPKPSDNFVPFIKAAHKDSKIDLFSVAKRAYYNVKEKYTFSLIFHSLFPIVTWVKRYKLNYLKDDVIASLTIAFMLIPQAMAYAMLAGLKPIYGLYSAFISPIVYGIFGTSNEIQVGPVAMVSLLVPSIIGLPTSDENYATYAMCLSLLSGLILLVFGLFRVGFIIENLLSNPILLGFIQAGSTLIILSQIKNFTAIPIPSTAATIIDYGEAIVSNISKINGYTVLMGGVCLAILIGTKYINQRLKYKIPTAIIILVLGTLISFLVDVKGKLNIKIVDTIPSGIPKPQLVPLTIEKISKMIVGSFIVSILGFVESISIGKKFASYRKYTINTSQELVALGMCNIIQSVFSGYSTTGSFSRTAVAYQMQSRSRLTSILSGLIVMIVLLLLTQVFKYTPLCILSAIVISAAITLYEFKETIELYKKGELIGFFQLIFIFIMTLLVGSETGIIIAFVVSILQIIFFSARPNLVILGRLPGTLVFRNVNHYPNAITYPGVMIVRFDSRLTYYTVNHFRDLMNNMDLSPANSSDIKVIIFDAVNISSIDSTAMDVLSDMLDIYESLGIVILWSDLRPILYRTMNQSGFLQKLNRDHIFTSTSAAVDYAISNNKEILEVTSI